MAPSQSTMRYIMFGGILSLSLLGLGLFYYFGSSKKSNKTTTVKETKTIKDTSTSKSTTNNNKEQPTQAIPTKKQPSQQVVDVEDVEDSDEEGDGDEEEVTGGKVSGGKMIEEVDPRVAELLEVKEKYDTAVRLSKKYIDGQRYQNAIDQLTDAITYAATLNTKAQEIVLLYNNRSAMYEKLAKYDECTRDITVILTMDPNHLRARLRRARVFEEKKKIR